jgi:hypothetical protein
MALTALLTCAAVISAPAPAQVQQVGGGRMGKLDFYGLINWNGSTHGTLSNFPNVDVNLDHTTSWGFGTAYHFTDNLSVLFDLMYGNGNIRYNLKAPVAQPVATPQVTSWADYFNGRVNIEFTGGHAQLAPVISAGIGFNNFQSAIPGANPQVYCGGFAYWWCTTGVPTFSTTAFSYNAQVGLRWDSPGSFFLKLTYGATWADYSGVQGTRTFEQVMLQIGGRSHY